MIISVYSIRRDVEIALRLGIIDNKGVANSLAQKLNAAETNIQKGKSLTAQNILNALKQEAEAQKGNHIKEPFASTLFQDIEILSSSLPEVIASLSLLLANLYSILAQLLELLSRL